MNGRVQEIQGKTTSQERILVITLLFNPSGEDRAWILFCSQAEAREAKFNQSAGGKAARKAVANVAKEREADAASRRDNNNAKDWLT